MLVMLVCELRPGGARGNRGNRPADRMTRGDQTLSDTLRLNGELFILAALPVPRFQPRWKELTPHEANEVVELKNRAMRTACGHEVGFTQPISFRRSEIKTIRSARFLVALKTDGERVQLFLTRSAGVPRGYLLFRSERTCEVEVEAIEPLFTGTLVDGELVVDGGRNLLLLFDAIVLAGKGMQNSAYTERHAAMREMCERGSLQLAQQSRLELFVKKIYPAAFCASVWRGRSSQQHISDGLIFTADAGHECFKWKLQATVDILMKRSNQSVGFARKGKSNVRLVHLRLGGGSESHSVLPILKSPLLVAYFHSHPESEEVVVEAFVERLDASASSLPTLRLHPARLRLDKASPNHFHTIAEAAFAAIEGITSEELAEKLKS